MNFECIFYRYFHIYCPGCGGTRSLAALFQGDIGMSLWYHPLVVYVVLVFLFRVICLISEYVLHKTLMRKAKFYTVFLSIAMGIVLLNWLLKNILLLCFEIKLI